MDNILPAVTEAETYLLSMVLNKPKLLDYIPYINAIHFSVHSNQIVFKAIKILQKEESIIDLITLSNKLKTMKDNLVNNEYMVTDYNLANLVSVASSFTEELIEHYSEMIMTSFARRWLLFQLGKRTDEIKDLTNPNVDESVSAIMENIDGYIALQPKIKTNIKKDCEDAYDDLTTRNPVISSKIGFGDHEMKIERRQINILGGLPGHLKTTTAIQILENIANSGLKGLGFSLEMPKSDLIAKMACNLAGLSHRDMRENKCNSDDLKLLREKITYISDSFAKNIKIIDNVYDINVMIRMMKQYQPDIVFVDFLQLIVEDEKNMRPEINNALRRFKIFVKHSDIALLLLSQISREVEKREDPRPRNSDLAESGRIEQLSANVFFVYYDYKVNYANDTVIWSKGRLCYGKEILTLIQSKARYSDTFTTYLIVNAPTGHIRTMTVEEYSDFINLRKRIMESRNE